MSYQQDDDMREVILGEMARGWGRGAWNTIPDEFLYRRLSDESVVYFLNQDVLGTIPEPPSRPFTLDIWRSIERAGDGFQVIGEGLSERGYADEAEPYFAAAAKWRAAL